MSRRPSGARSGSGGGPTPSRWKIPTLVSAVRFDGYFDANYEYPAGWVVRTKFDHRMPTNYGNGFGLNKVAILEAENAAASAVGIDAWAFDTYTPYAITGVTDPNPKFEALMNGHEAYLASSNKSLIKFWLTLIVDNRFGISYPPSAEYKYVDNGAWTNWLASMVADPQYLRINGAPCVGLYTGGPGAALSLARWQALLAPIGGQSGVFAISMNGNASDVTTYSLQAGFTYGINNLPNSSGHVAYSVLAAKDAAQWPAPLAGTQRTPQLTPSADRRALDGTPIPLDTFADMPTVPEWYSQWQLALAQTNNRTCITFWNELAEEGAACVPTAQEGTRFLDPISWAKSRGDTKPGSYTYPINAYSLVNTADVAMANNGTWTYVTPYTYVANAHDRDELISTALGDYKQLTHVRMTACSVYWMKGPDRGIAEIFLDGVSQGTFDQYAASVSIGHADLTMASGTHAVKIVDTNTKNASSSSTRIGVDYFNVTYVP